MNFSSQSVLLWTGASIGLELLICAALLAKLGQFRWLSTGFWAWVSFLLYFVVTPLAALQTANLYDFEIRLQISGGEQRGYWVAAMAFLGIFFFFGAYLHTYPKSVSPGFQHAPLANVPFLLWLVLFIGYGSYALLASRSGLASWSGEETIVGGRFVGSVTGYQNAGYIFLFFPILLLLQWTNRPARAIGLMLAIGFVLLSIPHAWSRYVTVSMLLALSMLQTAKSKRNWPSAFLLLAIFALVMLYQARGHQTWEFENLQTEILQNFDIAKNRGLQAVTQSDTQMLASFWVESYLYDTWVGYDYGLTLLNYAATGWIPGRFFPEKYFLVDWLNSQRPTAHSPILDQLLYGAKSTLIGAAYRNGGWIAVIISMLCLGNLSRHLDQMLVTDAPIHVRALGIAWLSNLWMIWGSGEQWGLMLLGSISIPAIFFWILTALQHISSREAAVTYRTPILKAHKQDSI